MKTHRAVWQNMGATFQCPVHRHLSLVCHRTRTRPLTNTTRPAQNEIAIYIHFLECFSLHGDYIIFYPFFSFIFRKICRTHFVACWAPHFLHIILEGMAVRVRCLPLNKRQASSSHRSSSLTERQQFFLFTLWVELFELDYHRIPVHLLLGSNQQLETAVASS